MTIRRRDDSSCSEAWSASAATGGMRTARRAGLMADTRVTPTPTTRAAITVRDWKTSGPVGRVTPNPLRSASRPTAARTPSPRPTSEATTPRMVASRSTERNTWRRLAPTILNSASSRVRWPTMIEKVLKMVNPPTNREMNANTSRAVEKNDRAWLMSLVCSLATVCPVTTSTPAGSTVAISCCRAGLSVPGLAATSMALKRPTRPNSCWAVGRSNAARVAPARLSAVPNRTMPVRVKVRGGPSSRTRTCSPTAKWYFCAVPASITTSLGVVGGRPRTSWSEEICWSGSYENPSVGAPPVVMALPSGATNCA